MGWKEGAMEGGRTGRRRDEACLHLMAEAPDCPATRRPRQPTSPGTPEAVERPGKTMNRYGRGEIDTSPPFGSVKEAVVHFEDFAGAAVSPSPLPVLRHPPRGADTMFDASEVEKQAAELERDLKMKEQETLDVLKELNMSRRMVEELRWRLQLEASERIPIPEFAQDLKLSPENGEGSSQCTTPRSSILMELRRARSNLHRTTTDLAVIRASVESLTENLFMEKAPPPGGRRSTSSGSPSPFRMGRHPRKPGLGTADICGELQQLNHAAEQFIKMAEESKSQVLMAMSEIESRKRSMGVAEMRWAAARKMEEAAKAVEAVAIAEMRSLSGDDISSLARRGRTVETPSRKKAVRAVTAPREGADEGRDGAMGEASERSAKGRRTWPISDDYQGKDSLADPRYQDSRFAFIPLQGGKPISAEDNETEGLTGHGGGKPIPAEDTARDETAGLTGGQKVAFSDVLGRPKPDLSAYGSGDERQRRGQAQNLKQRKSFGFIPLPKLGRKKLHASRHG